MERVSMVVISLAEAKERIKAVGFWEDTEPTMLEQVEQIAIDNAPMPHGQLYVGICSALGINDGEWLLVYD